MWTPVVVTLLTVFLIGGLIALMLWGFSIDAEDAPPCPCWWCWWLSRAW